MPENVDRAGVFIFEVVESAIGVTQKNQYPQWVARLKTVQKWVDSEEEMKHFEIKEPAYVEWADQETLAYLCLFNSSSEFTVEGKGRTAMLNYDQLKLALGWDGTEFDTLADGSMVGKKLQGRVEEDTYNDRVSLKVQWIDSVDAPATRSLKSLAPDAVSALTAKLKLNVKKVVAAPAKPATVKPGKPPSAGSTAATTAAPSVVTPATNTAPAQTVPSEPAKTPKAPKAPKATTKATPPPPAAVKEESTGLSKTSTKDAAWEYVNEHKGETTDTDVEEAWIAACGEVGENKDEDKFTEEDWAKVRDITLKDLAI